MRQSQTRQKHFRMILEERNDNLKPTRKLTNDDQTMSLIRINLRKCDTVKDNHIKLNGHSNTGFYQSALARFFFANLSNSQPVVQAVKGVREIIICGIVVCFFLFPQRDYLTFLKLLTRRKKMRTSESSTIKLKPTANTNRNMKNDSNNST